MFGSVVDEPRVVPPQAAPWSACVPSGWLAMELDTVTADAASLDDAELVDAIVGFDRVVSWGAARQARLLAEFTRRRPADHDPGAARARHPSVGSRFAADEIGLALRISRAAAVRRLGLAGQLGGELIGTLRAWEAGEIDASKVRAIAEATAQVTPEQATAVQDRVLTRAPGQSVGQLRAALARAVIATDPQGAAERHLAARRERRVGLGQEAEGMASLWAMLPAPQALSAYEWLTRLARGMGAEDPRGMDARRADLLVELLTGHLTLTPPPTSDAPTSDAPGHEPPADAPATKPHRRRPHRRRAPHRRSPHRRRPRRRAGRRRNPHRRRLRRRGALPFGCRVGAGPGAGGGAGTAGGHPWETLDSDRDAVPDPARRR